ncbi:DUF1648 domain-containing protein [Peribacillus sp. NPDC097675]|uniref:DUF1648 domain-containing protein n=1 Tax=Peribacillus sp. NPDC097675 TaxID=3390618 RepID=UPI003CFCBA21
MRGIKQLRQIIKRNRTPLEIILDILSLLFLIASLLYIITEWSSLPSRIPFQFNFGEVKIWGSKGSVIALPLFGVVIWIGLSILEKFPQHINFPFFVQENKEMEHRNNRILLNMTKNVVVIFFTYTNWTSIQLALI